MYYIQYLIHQTDKGNIHVGVHFITLSLIANRNLIKHLLKISMKYWHMHLTALKLWLQTSHRCSDRLALYLFYLECCLSSSAAAAAQSFSVRLLADPME